MKTMVLPLILALLASGSVVSSLKRYSSDSYSDDKEPKHSQGKLKNSQKKSEEIESSDKTTVIIGSVPVPISLASKYCEKIFHGTLYSPTDSDFALLKRLTHAVPSKASEMFDSGMPVYISEEDAMEAKEDAKSNRTIREEEKRYRLDALGSFLTNPESLVVDDRIPFAVQWSDFAKVNNHYIQFQSNNSEESTIGALFLDPKKFHHESRRRLDHHIARGVAVYPICTAPTLALKDLDLVNNLRNDRYFEICDPETKLTESLIGTERVCSTTPVVYRGDLDVKFFYIDRANSEIREGGFLSTFKLKTLEFLLNHALDYYAQDKDQHMRSQIKEHRRRLVVHKNSVGKAYKTANYEFKAFKKYDRVKKSHEYKISLLEASLSKDLNSKKEKMITQSLDKLTKIVDNIGNVSEKHREKFETAYNNYVDALNENREHICDTLKDLLKLESDSAHDDHTEMHNSIGLPPGSGAESFAI